MVFTWWSTAELEGCIQWGEKLRLDSLYLLGCVERASSDDQPPGQDRQISPQRRDETRLQWMSSTRAGVETLQNFYGSKVGETREHNPRFTARRYTQEGASEMSGGSARSEVGWRFIHSPNPKASMLALTWSEGLRRTRWRA